MAKVDLDENKALPQETADNDGPKIEIKRKRTIGRLAEVFIGKDVGSVRDYIIFDVVIPAIKNAIVDAVGNGIRMLLGVDTRDKRRGDDYDTPYSTYYKSNRRDNNRNDIARRHTRDDYRDIVFASEDGARDAIRKLKTRAYQYNTASVADYKDILQITSGDFQENYWGWSKEEIERLSERGPRRASGGWVLDLPEVHDIR